MAENVTEWGAVKAMLIPVTDDPEEAEYYKLVASMVARKYGLS